MPTKKKAVGRPKAITPKIVSKLEEAFKIDATVEQACFYAGIGKATYYRALDNRKGFRDEMERAQSYPYMIAKATVMKAMKQGNGALALRWLERRESELYGSPSVPDTSNAVEWHVIEHKPKPSPKSAVEAKALAEARIAEKQKAGVL